MKKLSYTWTMLFGVFFAGCASSEQDKTIVLPQMEARNQQTLEIDSITRSDTATVLHIKAFYHPNYWIKVASGSFLEDDLGNTYRISRGVGIDLDKEFWMPESGETSFRLVFPPLQAKAAYVDFSEGDFDGSYKMWGIRLTNRKPDAFELPEGMDEAEPDRTTPLPVPSSEYGNATLKGQIVGFRKGMPDEGGLYMQGVLSQEGEQKIRITDDGSFELAVPVAGVSPCMLRLSYGSFGCLLAPGETTSLVINPIECSRRQSRLLKDRPANGKAVYYGGYLAGLQQELADAEPFPELFGSSYEEFTQKMNEIAGMSAEEFKDYLFRFKAEGEKAVNESGLSEAAKELSRIKLQLSVAETQLRAVSLLKEAYIVKHNLSGEDAKVYYTKTKIELPRSYYDCWQELPLVFSPKACYSGILGNLIQSLQYQKSVPAPVAAHSGMMQQIKAARLGSKIAEFTPFTEAEMKEAEALPAYLREMLMAQNKELLRKIDENKRKIGFTVHDIKNVENKDVFPALISKFRGHTLLIDFWATWCGPCKMAHKAMEPLKDELKDKDIVYLYIAGENSPEGSWKNMIPDIKGEHFRISQKQWDYLSDYFKIKGVPTYFIVDKNGEIVYKETGFSGTEVFKEKLLEVVDRQ